jgi:hypothetical protein
VVRLETDTGELLNHHKDKIVIATIQSVISFSIAGGNPHCPGHYFKVIKCIMQLMLGLFVDE